MHAEFAGHSILQHRGKGSEPAMHNVPEQGGMFGAVAPHSFLCAGNNFHEFAQSGFPKKGSSFGESASQRFPNQGDNFGAYASHGSNQGEGGCPREGNEFGAFAARGSCVQEGHFGATSHSSHAEEFHFSAFASPGSNEQERCVGVLSSHIFPQEQGQMHACVQNVSSQPGDDSASTSYYAPPALKAQWWKAGEVERELSDKAAVNPAGMDPELAEEKMLEDLTRELADKRIVNSTDLERELLAKAAVNSMETPPSSSVPVPRALVGQIGIPRIDPTNLANGQLLNLLSIFGVVFMDLRSSDIAEPSYKRWSQLLSEANHAKARFYNRPCVKNQHLRLSRREDLRRTIEGVHKEHTPDNRAIFGISDCALRISCDWGDVQWILDDYHALKAKVVQLIVRHLKAVCGNDIGSMATLSAKLRRGRESWTQSACRHCFYPQDGSCTEHTDYGLVTLQHSSATGLQGFIAGEWQDLEAPREHALLYAGDMLERFTNGQTKALLHRVHLDGPRQDSASPSARRTRRQSHVFFLQPDSDTIVGPARCFRKWDGTDLRSVRYGDWHREKVSLAFGLPRPQAAGSVGPKAAADDLPQPAAADCVQASGASGARAAAADPQAAAAQCQHEAVSDGCASAVSYYSHPAMRFQ